MSLSSLHCVLGHVDSSLHCEDDSSSLSRSMLSNVPRRQTFSEKGDMASVQGGWRRRAGLTGLGMYSTGRCQRLPWIPATIFCTTHVPSAMQNNTDLSNECRACEKGGSTAKKRNTASPTAPQTTHTHPTTTGHWYCTPRTTTRRRRLALREAHVAVHKPHEPHVAL